MPSRKASSGIEKFRLNGDHISGVAEELDLLKRLDRISPIIRSTAAAGFRWRSCGGGDFHRPPTRRAAEEDARAMGGQAEAEHHRAASRAQSLPVPSARQVDRPAKPEPALAKAGARNPPATRSPRCCAITGSRSAWMTRAMPRQHLRRALVVDREARMGLSASSGQRHRTAAQPCRVLRLV